MKILISSLFDLGLTFVHETHFLLSINLKKKLIRNKTFAYTLICYFLPSGLIYQMAQFKYVRFENTYSIQF